MTFSFRSFHLFIYLRGRGPHNKTAEKAFKKTVEKTIKKTFEKTAEKTIEKIVEKKTEWIIKKITETELKQMTSRTKMIDIVDIFNFENPFLKFVKSTLWLIVNVFFETMFWKCYNYNFAFSTDSRNQSVF